MEDDLVFGYESGVRRNRGTNSIYYEGYRYNLSKIKPNKSGGVTEYWRCGNRQCKGWLVKKGQEYSQTREHTICVPNYSYMQHTY